MRFVWSQSGLSYSLKNHYFMKPNATKIYRILVVDDEPDVTELLKYKLEQEGYRVRF